MFHKGLNTWNTWNILHTARKCAHDAMHTPHQQADDSMIVGNKGGLGGGFFGCHINAPPATVTLNHNIVSRLW